MQQMKLKVNKSLTSSNNKNQRLYSVGCKINQMTKKHKCLQNNNF